MVFSTYPHPRPFASFGIAEGVEGDRAPGPRIRSEVSGGMCSDYEVKTVRCNVSELVPSPAAGPDSFEKNRKKLSCLMLYQSPS